MMKIVKSRDVFGKEYDVPVQDLTWRPAAYAIIVRDDQVLLVSERGSYHLPGGGVSLGEDPEEAVIREAKEETGLTVASPRLVGSLSTFFTPTYAGGSAEGPAHVQSLLLYYVCTVESGELSLDGLEDDEREYGLAPGWVPVKKLDSIRVGSTVDWRPIVKRALA